MPLGCCRASLARRPPSMKSLSNHRVSPVPVPPLSARYGVLVQDSSPPVAHHPTEGSGYPGCHVRHRSLAHRPGGASTHRQGHRERPMTPLQDVILPRVTPGAHRASRVVESRQHQGLCPDPRRSGCRTTWRHSGRWGEVANRESTGVRKPTRRRRGTIFRCWTIDRESARQRPPRRDGYTTECDHP